MSAGSSEKINSHTTYDTLHVTTNDVMAYGGKGDILVDDGTDVIQKPVGADTYVLTYDDTQPANLSYKPYLSTINLRLAIQGGITTADNATRYSGFNVRIARSYSNVIDFYTVPYDVVIESIELIPLPSGNVFSWSSFTNVNYHQYTMGYETAGAFTQFNPPGTHFTVGNAVAPLAGVTHYNRSGLFNTVRYTPPSPWAVLAGNKITLKQFTVGTPGVMYIIVMLYLKGDIS